MKALFFPMLLIVSLFVGCQGDHKPQRQNQEAPVTHLHGHGRQHMKVLDQGDENHPAPMRGEMPATHSGGGQGHDRP